VIKSLSENTTVKKKAGLFYINSLLFKRDDHRLTFILKGVFCTYITGISNIHIQFHFAPVLRIMNSARNKTTFNSEKYIPLALIPLSTTGSQVAG
jgi:hypothetical protein